MRSRTKVNFCLQNLKELKLEVPETDLRNKYTHHISDDCIKYHIYTYIHTYIHSHTAESFYREENNGIICLSVVYTVALVVDPETSILSHTQILTYGLFQEVHHCTKCQSEK
jgi:hypothetical protein